MRAVVQDGYGEPEQVLRLEEDEAPTPGPGEVLVRVEAAGVNAADRHVATGEPLVMRLAWGDLRGRRRQVGSDLAGTVERAGPGVTGLRPGQRVVGSGRATFAERAVAREEHLCPLPDDVPAVLAGSLPMAGLTAWQGLHAAGGLRTGDRVLVTGASGGVGTFAVQMARSLGAHVTGTCSTRNLDLVSAAGADEVVDYTAGAVPPPGERYDLVLHVAGPTPLRSLRRALRPGGALVVVNGEGGRWVGPLPLVAKMAVLHRFSSDTLLFLNQSTSRDDLALLVDLVRTGRVTPVVERSVELAAAPEAVAHLRSGHTRGKTVVAVGS